MTGRHILPHASPRRTARILIAILIALILSAAIIRNAAGRMALDDDGTHLAFSTGPLEARKALLDVAAANGVVSSTVIHRAIDALRRAPLAAEPFAVAGMNANTQGNDTRATTLFEEARRRDPRLVVARFWLLDAYLGQGRYTDAIREIAPAIALQPAARTATLALATAMLSVPAARPALLAELRAVPRWRPDFIRLAVVVPTTLPTIERLLLAFPNADRRGRSIENQSLLDAMVAAGRTRAAYDAWLALDHRAARWPGAIDDPDFAGKAGFGPFTWRLPGDLAISTALAGAPRRTALSIDADVQSPTTIARQLVVLAGGDQRLNFIAWRPDDAGQQGASLGVEVRCGADGAVLAMRDIVLQDRPTRSVTPFVSDGCPAVSVRFLARPGTDGGALRALLTAVSIDRADRP